MSPLSILDRIFRGGGRPGPQPNDEVPRSDGPADMSSDSAVSDMMYRTPSFSRPQPEDVFSDRVARSAGVSTDPMTPRRAFDQAIETSEPNTGQVLRQRIQRSPQPARPTGQQDSDLAMPPPPPTLQPVRASTPMPTREQHDTTHSGFGARLMDALYAGAQGLRYGLPGALGGIARGAVDPQFAHDLRFRKQEARYEQTAKPEREAIEAENRGKIQQAQLNDAYYKGGESRERIIDTRVNRQRQDEDRNTAAADRQTRLSREQQSFEETARHNRAIEGKGSAPYRFHDVDQSTGETYVMSVDPTTGKAIRTDVGAQGRIQREPRGPDYQAPHVVLNQATSDKEQFENMKEVQLPKARAQVVRLQSLLESLSGDQAAPVINDPEIAAIFAAMPGANREDKRAAVAASLEKAKTEADQLQKRMHTHINDTKTKYGRYGRFLETGGEGDYPYMKLHPEFLQDEEDQPAPVGGKRTGLLDVTSQRVKR